MRARFAIAKALPFDVKLHAVAVTPRFTGHNANFRRRLQFPQPAQFLFEDGAFGGDLRLI